MLASWLNGSWEVRIWPSFVEGLLGKKIISELVFAL
jgi:hypothetical protein